MPRLRTVLLVAAASVCAALLGAVLMVTRTGPAPLQAAAADLAPTLRPDGVIRLLTYNIHWGRGADGVHDLQRVADVLRRIDADVVLLTEVDVYWRRSGNVHQPQYLAQAAGYPYWYFAPAFSTWASGGLRRSQYGNLLLSRFPIARARTVPLPNPLGTEPRAALTAELTVGEHRLTVIGTHLGLSKTERLAQTAALRSLAEEAGIPACSSPVVLLGDFNAHPDSSEMQLLTPPVGSLLDAHRLGGSGDGYTFPFPEPYARIDYVLVSPDLAAAVVGAGPITTPGSDHLPVAVDLRWPPSLCPALATGDAPG